VLSSPTQTGLTLGWTPHGLNLTLYQIWNQTGAYRWQQVGMLITLPGHFITDTSATLNTLTCGTNYTLAVTATNRGGTSTRSDTVSGSTLPCTPALDSPALLNDNVIRLQWTDGGSNTAAYHLERSLSPNDGFASLVNILPGFFDFIPGASGFSFSDNTTECGKTYYYRLHSTDTAGDSPLVTSSGVTTVCVPTAPGNLVVQTVTPRSVNLKWADNSNNETGFVIWISRTGNDWSQAATTGANVTSYTLNGFSAGEKLYFQVTAMNTGGNSDPSTSVGARTWRATFLPALRK